MTPVPHNCDAMNNNDDVQASHPAHPDNLVAKVYTNILSNKLVQTSIKQISRISQPIIEEIDHKLVRLTNKVKRIVSGDNIYNTLSNIWLSHTLPFNGIVVSFETMVQDYDVLVKKSRRHQIPKSLNLFYQFACESWSTLIDPTTEDIKSTMFKVVARTINKAYHFEDETLANSLYSVLKTVVDDRKEFISCESFVKLVKTSVGDDFINKNYQTVDVPCSQFYVFAKRFILLDFPLATDHKDVVAMIKHFIQDNTFSYGDSTLNFIEHKLDLLTKLTGQKSIEYAEDHTIVEKAQRVYNKALNLSGYPKKMLECTYVHVQGTRPYMFLDSRFHLTDKIDNGIFLANTGLKVLKKRFIEPSINTIQVISNKAKSQVTVIIHDLDIHLLKKKFAELHSKYEVLQKCAVIIAGETVKLVFDKHALAEIGEKGKKELLRVYHELKALEAQKIREISLEYYASILKKAKKTYHIACQEVKSEKSEKKKVCEKGVSTDMKPSDNSGFEKKENDSPSTMAGEKEVTGEEESH